MNWEFFIGQCVVIIIAGTCGFWAVSNKIDSRFDKQDEDHAKVILQMRSEFEGEIEKVAKSSHETKSSVFARLDLLKLEIERTYMRSEMANEKFHNLEEKNNQQLTAAITLLQREFGYVREELVKINKKMEQK